MPSSFKKSGPPPFNMPKCPTASHPYPTPLHTHTHPHPHFSGLQATTSPPQARANTTLTEPAQEAKLERKQQGKKREERPVPWQGHQRRMDED